MEKRRYIGRLGSMAVMLVLAAGQLWAQSLLKNEQLEHATVTWYKTTAMTEAISSVELSNSSATTLYLKIEPEAGWWTSAETLNGKVALTANSQKADARRRSISIGDSVAVTAVSGETYHKYGGGLYQVVIPALYDDQTPNQIASLELTGEMTKCRTITPAISNMTMEVVIDGGAVTYAKPGEQIDVTFSTAVEGYQFNHFTVTYNEGTSQQEVVVTTINEGSRSFTMPDGDVTIDASYIAPRPYALKNEAGDVLTIYFGGIATDGYDSNNSTWRTSEDSGWGEIKTSLTTVIIDPAMANCTSLTSMAYWFSGCTNLTEIQGLEYLKTQNVTDMSYLFEGCEGFEKLNLTTFDTRQVTDMTAMFKGCTNLKRIFVDTNWSNALVTSSNDMFTGCAAIRGYKGTIYDASHTDKEYAKVDATGAPGYLMPNAQLYTNFDNGTLTFYYDTETRSGVRREGSQFKNGVSDSMSDNSTKFNWGGTINTVVFDESMDGCDDITSLSWWFANHNTIQYVRGIEHLNMANVTDIKYVFWYSQSLKEFDFSKFDTKNVTMMLNAFYRMGAHNIDISTFDTRSAVHLGGVFGWSTALDTITIGGVFDTRNYDLVTYPQISTFRGVYSNNLVRVKDAANHHIDKDIFDELEFWKEGANLNRRLESDVPLPEGEVTERDGYLWWKGGRFASYNGFYHLKMGTPQNGSIALTTDVTYTGYAEKGQTLTIKATPNIGYELTSVTLTYNDGTEKTETATTTDTPNVVTLTMAGAVATVNATFQPIMKAVDPTKAVSKDNPYAIRTVEDMRNLSLYYNSGAPWTRNTYFKVIPENAVLDFSGVNDYLPIGNSQAFTSSFDGNGMTVKNLHVSISSGYAGLFGYVSSNGSHTIQHIDIDNSCSFTNEGNTTSGSVSPANGMAGSIAGGADYTLISHCRNLGAPVKGGYYVGGVIGHGSYPNIQDCSNLGSVSATAYVGGILGYLDRPGTLKNNTVGMGVDKTYQIIIQGDNYVGAILGYNYRSSTYTNNVYNGMTVTVKKGETDYTIHGYGHGNPLSDMAGIRSATGGLFPAIVGHQAKGLTWNYDLYTKTYTILGTPDPGYELASVTISYPDATGEIQTLTKDNLQTDPWTFQVAEIPTAESATYATIFKPVDPTQPYSEDNPYAIRSVKDMQNLSAWAGVGYCRSAYFKVVPEHTVFDFEGETLEPIGNRLMGNNKASSFASSFDGNGVTIKNLHISTDNTKYCGLFGYADQAKAVIKNITIDKSCSFSSTNANTGAILGYGYRTTVSNCKNMGAPITSSNDNTGGIVGGIAGDQYNYAQITNCVSEADVSGSNSAGGIVGSLGNYVNFTNNEVGILAPQDTIIAISGTKYVGAVTGSGRGSTQSGNFYNGMVVVRKIGETETKGFGYGVGNATADGNGVNSASGDYFPTVTGHQAKGMTWNYDLYTDSFTIAGVPDTGYDLMTVTVKYRDDNGQDQTIVFSDTLATSWTQYLPGFPRSIMAEFVTIIDLLDPTKPCSKENPYVIRTIEDMQNLSTWVNAGVRYTRGSFFKVIPENAVLDFKDVDFKPIGNKGMGSFNSSFDGNGVTIKNLKMTNSDDTKYCGLFGYADNPHATIENINIDKSCSFTSNGSYTGAVVGCCFRPTLKNCHNLGATVNGVDYVGGVAGYATGENHYYSTSYNYKHISYYVLYTGHVTDCSSEGSVSGRCYVGGLLGAIGSYCTLERNLVGMQSAKNDVITVEGTNSVGAVTGSGNGSPQTANYYNGMVVVRKIGEAESWGFGYGRGSAAADGSGVNSATGDYFPSITGHQANGLAWNYDLYTKEFKIVGKPDPGYKLMSATVKYTDAEDKVQTLAMDSLTKSPWTIQVPAHPIGVTGTYATIFQTQDSTKPLSKDNPYIISTVEDMQNLSAWVSVPYCRGAYFKVMPENTVLDFEGINFEPIGNKGRSFASSFDGNGVTIKNLKITNSDNTKYWGLFGAADNPEHNIENITIDKSCAFTSSGSYTGSVLGYGYRTSVNNCRNLGAPVSGGDYTGGIVGYVYGRRVTSYSYQNGQITDCASEASVSGTQYVGGIIGAVGNYCSLVRNTVGMQSAKSDIINITGNHYVGAVTGSGVGSSRSDNCYNGMVVTVRVGDAAYTDFAYGVGGTPNDVAGVTSATGGYCGQTTVDSGKNVVWHFNLYTGDFDVSGNGAMADYSKTTPAWNIIKDSIETLTIHHGVTEIGKKAFNGWTKLHTITLDSCEIAVAPDDAFTGCTAMTEGTVIVLQRIPFTEETGLAFLNVVTKGLLLSDETIDLTPELEQTADSLYAWKGGKFTLYSRNPVVLELPTAISGLVYNGKPQELVKAGKVQSGKIMYSLQGSESFSEEIPTATNAGLYTVYYYVKGAAEVHDGKVTEQPITVSIGKRAPAVEDFMLMLPDTLAYDGTEKAVAIISNIIGIEIEHIYYNGEETVPCDIGTYQISIDVAGSPNNDAIIGLSSDAWIFNIVRAMDIRFGEGIHWTTYYAEENLTTPDGLTAFVVDDLKSDAISIMQVDYIPKDVGVLLYREETDSILDGCQAIAYQATPTAYTSLLKGYHQPYQLTKGTGYVLYKDEFVLTGDGTLPAHRCYLPVDGNITTARLAIGGDGDETTHLDNRAKTVIDGSEDDAWYDLNGRKLDRRPKRKGVYIHQGKKVVVK